ncbi:hypothetical protein CL619_01285 [archaeon]|nr:hypothetical protein [archaeon]|tara:strand:- start:1004 stop:1888 length:885 start_codon:yes stop_codon:yes gene_type:complete
MQRKLVQMGKHTLMVTIPSKWIKRHNLNKGDQVNFSEVENTLVLRSNKEIYEKKTSIHLSSSSIELVWRMLQPAYTSGYDELELTYKDPKTLATIQGCMPWMLGFEIVETQKNKLLIKSISKQLDTEFPIILQRCFHILSQMGIIMNEILQKRDFSRLKEIQNLEFSINKYTMFCKRVINRTGYKYPHYSYMVVVFLELAANHIEYIRRYIEREKRKIKIEKEVQKEFSKIPILIANVHSLYVNYSNEEFVEIAELQPHFKWFEKIKDTELRFNMKTLAEYLVQIARQTAALNL